MSGVPAAESRPSLGIVGLGLMGASLGLGVAGAYRRVGCDADADVAAAALARGVVDEIAALEDMARGVDIVVVAAPVDRIPQLVTSLGRAGCTAVIADVGSAKRHIVAAMDELPDGASAIGGHPMCGREVPGLDAAQADLYANAAWALCASRRTDDRARRTLAALVEQLGGRTVEVDAATHDRIVAATSHLPYALGGALGLALDERAIDSGLFGGGLLDATRLAAGGEHVWRAILRENRDLVGEAVTAMESQLGRLRDALDGGDDALAAWVDEAAARARAIRAHRAG